MMENGWEWEFRTLPGWNDGEPNAGVLELTDADVEIMWAARDKGPIPGHRSPPLLPDPSRPRHTPHQPVAPITSSPSSEPVAVPTPTVPTPPSGTSTSLSASLCPQSFVGLDSPAPAPRGGAPQPTQATPGSGPLPPPAGLPPPIPRSGGLTRLPPPAQPIQTPPEGMTPLSPGLMHQGSPALRPVLGTPSMTPLSAPCMTPQSGPVSDADTLSLPAPSETTVRTDNAAVTGPTPPCSHNVWDNVRAKKDCVTLCCRECRARWKPCSRTLRRCPEFQTAAGCPRGADCPLTHVFKFKQPTKARRRLESAAGSEMSPATHPLPTSPPVEPGPGLPLRTQPVSTGSPAMQPQIQPATRNPGAGIRPTPLFTAAGSVPHLP